MFDSVKVYVKGVGNSISDIFDSVVRYIIDGLLKLKVKTNFSFSVLVGFLFGFFVSVSVTVGNTAVLVVVVFVSVSVKKSESMFNDTESYFNIAIKNVVAKGDVDKALKLFDEVERLGSIFVRFIFISSVKGKG